LLNPLGVPSRMNVGHISRRTSSGPLGPSASTSNPASRRIESEIKAQLKPPAFPTTPRRRVFDVSRRTLSSASASATATCASSRILVDDKIHARSIDPYSLITQQALGGKSPVSEAQRFVEMESLVPRSLLSRLRCRSCSQSKSDDVEGRSQIYEAIVKGEVPDDPVSRFRSRLVRDCIRSAST